INQVHIFQQPAEKKIAPAPAESNQPTYFSILESNTTAPDGSRDGFEKHQENDVIDFYTERNIPRMLSREGPKAAVGDVNGDGLDDVYIGGTPAHAGQLYIQNVTGSFIKKEEKAFQQFLSFEDVAVTLFDCDHDGDLDLLICPGGNNNDVLSRELQLRLFKNDGKGNFTIAENAFPN